MALVNMQGIIEGVQCMVFCYNEQRLSHPFEAETEPEKLPPPPVLTLSVTVTCTRTHLLCDTPSPPDSQPLSAVSVWASTYQ